MENATQNNSDILDNANRALKAAKNEMNKPPRDLLIYSVCQNAKSATYNYLLYYMMSKNALDLKKVLNSALLLEACQNLDADFNGINLSQMSCREEEHDCDEPDYCISEEKAKECLNTANQIQELVYTKLGLSD